MKSPPADPAGFPQDTLKAAERPRNPSDRSASGSLSLRAMIVGFFIVMVDGYDTMMISFIAPLLARDLALSPTDLGKVFGIGYIGAIVGAIALGFLADRLGRKPMLILSLALASLTTVMCAYASTLGMLAGLRFFSGIALGGALPALISLAAEHAPPERRHGTITLMYIGYPIGAVVGGAVTAALLRYGPAAIFVGAGVTSFVALVMALWLPESLRKEWNAPSPVKARDTVLSSLQEQFAEHRLWPGLMLWLGLFSMLLVTYFLVSWTPTILVKSGLSPGKAALSGVLLNLGGVVGALGLAPLINRFGPYIPSALALGSGALLIALLGQDIQSVPLMMFALFITGVCIIGGQLNFPAMTVALYPPHVRGAGTGWTMGVGRIGSIVGPMLGGILLAANLSEDRLFLVAAFPPLVAAIALVIAGGLQRRHR